ncbi:MAG: hypothetical protein LBT23_12185, partial [Synergistaceae bacterium]|jgi:hypothetical protein|nr:hypothetical protein [Synergistaceae bacterium]
MDWVRNNYQKEYAPNSRETFRRETVHQFMEAGIIIYNPDNPGRAVNSPNAAYQAESATLSLLRTFDTPDWNVNLKAYLQGRETLIDRNAKAREQKLVPVEIDNGKDFSLSPGKHSELIKAIIEDFAPRFVPGSALVYAGDTGNKWGYFNGTLLAGLGIMVDSHGKMPDVVLFYGEKNWLVLVEAVTSHGPVDNKRYQELKQLFSKSGIELVYVSAFPDRSTMRKYLNDIAWETEVWAADSPSHLIHFDGEKFLGPY